MQTFLYFFHYDSDPVLLKLLVGGLWITDTANEILVLKSNWRILISEYGRISNLTQAQPELMNHTWVEAILVFAVQLYFIRRIWLFSGKKRWLFPACLALLSSWQIVGTVVYQIIGYGRPLTVLSTEREIGINISLRGAAVAVDVLVTISMVYLLNRQITPQFARTKHMMHRLLMITINSGMITAITAMATLILLKVQPDNLLYCLPELVLCSLYFSTFLANLNSRHYVSGENVTQLSSGLSFARGSETVLYSGNNSRRKGPNGMDLTNTQDTEMAVKIRTDRDIKIDESYLTPAKSLNAI